MKYPKNSAKALCRTCDIISVLDDSYEPTYLSEINWCDEVCGDGVNMGIKECDDGNTDPGDGCNSKCLVEKDFTCEGGTPFTPDICKYNIKPKPI
jgi:cysteine-rich repeat protein